MSIKQHILDDENVLAHCSTRNWVWACTDRRVLKYRQSTRGTESLHDLSFREISAVSLKNKPRRITYLLLSIVCMIFLVAWLYMLSNVESFHTGTAATISILMIGGSALFLYLWYNSKRSFFEFRGGGIIQQEPEMWRINYLGADDKDQVTEFVKTVREQLSDDYETSSSTMQTPSQP